MFNAHAGTDFIEGLLVTDFLSLAAQQFVDLVGGISSNRSSKSTRLCRSCATIDVQKYPALGVVNGHEQVVERGFVWYLGQVSDSDANRAGFVILILEGPLGRHRISFGFGNLIFQVDHVFMDCSLCHVLQLVAGSHW